MPMYGFICHECDETFEELVFSSSAVNDVICPNCGSPRVNKQLSRIATPSFSTGTSGSTSSASCAPSG
jgi:putative FmdB family regulatory protein